ncbi:hypothetical protein ACXC9Q_25710 (plasmid) [Kribbella sp. CWNU-51]
MVEFLAEFGQRDPSRRRVAMIGEHDPHVIGVAHRSMKTRLELRP